ncbi:MAG: type II toxin-antitoxin system RelE/ParE family toxin [Desulfopila sp.]
MRIFKTKWFARFARRENIADSKLVVAIREIENGLIDADYGGGLIKKRVARDGGGKSGGYRSIIAYRAEAKCVFMFCFAKSDKENLNKNEVAQYKAATGIYLGFSEIEITAALKQRELEEVTYHDEKI